MGLFPQVVIGFGGETCHKSKMELFANLVKNEKQFITFAKTSILDVWQGSEYVSKLTSKVKDVSLLNQLKYQS